MPLDGHSYLVAQGWTGSGTGLRQGAISRPLAIPQKKNLAGLGKDRDEAFPFWDHLFSAASKSIQVKISSGDDSDDSDLEPNAGVSLKRTSTGILSNRRPVTGASAENSGATTPDVDDTAPRLSLLATAKREAAKRGLYSRFFRGPILGPDSPLSEPAIAAVHEVAPPVSLPGGGDAAEEKPRKKKRKLQEREEEGRREGKRLRKEKKELKRVKKESREKRRGKEREENDAVTSSSDLGVAKEKKRKRKREAEDGDHADIGQAATESKRKGKQDAEKDSEQSDKRKRKEEKRKAKESLQAQPDMEAKKKRKRPVE